MSASFPKGWEKLELGSFCVEHRRRAKGTDLPIFSVSKDYGLIAQSELFDRRIASADTSNYKTLKRGEYAYDPMLLWTGSIGCLWRSDEAMISPAYTTFGVDNKTVLPRFFDTLIKMPRMIDRYRSISHGTNVRRKKAHFDDFASLVVAIPPLAEQRAIAEVLGAVEDAIVKTEAFLDEVERRKADLARAAAEARKDSYSVRLKDIIRSMDGGVSVSGELRRKEDGEYGVLRTSSVSLGIFKPENIKVIAKKDIARASTKPLADRIIFSRANTPELVGASAYVAQDHNDIYLSDKLWQIDVRDRNSICVRWLAVVLNSPRVRQLISLRANGTSSSMQNISKSALLSIAIQVPPIEVQKSLAGLADAVENRQILELNYLDQLRATYASLTQELLSGRLRLPANIIARHQEKTGQAA